MWVIYSACESSQMDEPAFWDNEAGWTTLGCAITFTEKEIMIYTLPHVPDDAEWMTVGDAHNLVDEYYNP